MSLPKENTYNELYPFIKRLTDILISIIGLIILSPIFLLIILLIYITSSRPIFFMQERVGRNWKTFKIIKFRTMVCGAQKLGPEVSSQNDPRITSLGKFLRKFKLDEIPQLINVLKGDMSIVGPRPEVMKYANYYSKEFSIILRIKPGISDYASIAYRNEASLLPVLCDCEKFYVNEIMPKKIDLYKQYLREIGFKTDWKIIFATLKAIL